MTSAVPEEVPLLHELALAVGGSLDALENCRAFVSALRARKAIAYAGVWIHEQGHLRRSRLAFGAPKERAGETELELSHPVFAFLGSAPYVRATAHDPEFPSLVTERDIEGGAYALFRLRDVGVLKLFSQDPVAFSECKLSQLRDAADRLACVLEACAARDALARGNAERAALGDSEARFRDFAETAADWFWETDQALRVTFLSEGHFAATGVDSSRVLGQTSEGRWREGDNYDAPRRAFVEDLKARRTFTKRELRWRGKDGRERVHSFSGKPVFAQDGGFLGYRGSARDVTTGALADAERARLETQLMQAQKMEAIGQLTGGIAHDFNNILATVLGFTELARDIVPSSEENLDRYLEEIQLAGERARNLVAQMLTFSRGGTGDVGELAVAPIVEEAAGLLRSTLPSSIQVTVSALAPDAAIESEAVSLQQVLMNLCINARDAMVNHKGQINLVLEAESGAGGHCDSCHAEVSGERVVLTVHDTGEGIAPEIHGRVFDPFFTTKAPGKGTGMGLSMVHGIVHRHGGHIQITSPAGHGTSLRIHWPAYSGEGAPHEPVLRPRALARGRGERILVVDDELPVGSFLVEILQRRGYTVEMTSQAEEAAERACVDPCPFDLLLTDQTMPALTGLELISLVRQAHPSLPVILCSGYGDAGTGEGELGPHAIFLRKPVSASELVLSVQALLNRAGDRDPAEGDAAAS